MSRTKERLNDAGVRPSSLANRAARIPKTTAVSELADELRGLVQAQVALAAQLDEVVEEADDAQRRGEEQHQQRRRRDRLPGQRVRDEVPHPNSDHDRHPAHGRGAALGPVALRALLADLLAEALPREEPDQVRGEQDRDRERDPGRDEDASHATGSRWPAPAAPAASRSRPAAREALTRTTSPGRELAAQQRERRVGRGHTTARAVLRSVDGDQLVDAELHGGGGDLDVGGGRGVAELAHPAEDGPAPPRLVSPPLLVCASTCWTAGPAHRRRPRARVDTSAWSAARIDSGFALYASLTTVTPSGRSATSIRHRDTGAAAESTPATCSGLAPSSSATAAAASALPTWCAPTSRSATSAVPPGARA